MNVAYIRGVWGLHSLQIKPSFGSNKGFIEITPTYPIDRRHLTTRFCGVSTR